MREVIAPTVRGLAADGMPFTGFLYAGLMIDASGAPKVIEFNVRFGDPETQPVLARLKVRPHRAAAKRRWPASSIRSPRSGIRAPRWVW